MEIDNTLCWIGHSTFYIKSKKTIFIDPFMIPDTLTRKADVILITHAHYDHFSKPDIEKVMKPDTEIITSNLTLKGDEYKNIRIIKPGFEEEMGGFKLTSIPAYNLKEERLNFHPKTNNWMGYIINIEGLKIYHSGDTDFIPEMKNIDVDFALLPVGGTYTMDVNEMIEASKIIKAKKIIPVHYKKLLGPEGSEKAEILLKKSVPNIHIMKEVTN